MLFDDQLGPALAGSKYDEIKAKITLPHSNEFFSARWVDITNRIEIDALVAPIFIATPKPPSEGFRPTKTNTMNTDDFFVLASRKLTSSYGLGDGHY